MTPTVFSPVHRDAIVERLSRLTADAPRQWGTMTPGQMLTHCAVALVNSAGERAERNRLRVSSSSRVAPMGSVLSSKPYH